MKKAHFNSILIGFLTTLVIAGCDSATDSGTGKPDANARLKTLATHVKYFNTDFPGGRSPKDPSDSSLPKISGTTPAFPGCVDGVVIDAYQDTTPVGGPRMVLDTSR